MSVPLHVIAHGGQNQLCACHNSTAQNDQLWIVRMDEIDDKGRPNKQAVISNRDGAGIPVGRVSKDSGKIQARFMSQRAAGKIVP